MSITYVGELCELGDVEDGVPGFRIQTEQGVLTVTGFTREQIASFAALLFERVTLKVEAA